MKGWDKYGGAVVGAIRGWFIVGAVLFISILLPLPRSYYELLDQSVLATSAAKSVQIIYDTSQPLHRDWPSFLEQVEATLEARPAENQAEARKKKKRRPAEAILRQQMALQAARDRVSYFYGGAEEF